MRLSVVFSLQSGAVLDVATGNYYQHELRLFHGLQDHWQAGEIVVYDRAGGHFVMAASLGQRHVGLISRMLRRHLDCRRRRQRLGKGDYLMVWQKSAQKPAYLSEAEWAALPAEIIVRVVKIKVSRKGCRTQELFQFIFKLRLIRWSSGPLASLLARYRSLRICASLASRQRPRILRALISS